MRFLRKLIGKLLGLLLAFVLMSLAYLHAVGFPNFLKDYVVAQLQRRGIASRFGAIRLDLFRGVVANNAVLADAKAPGAPLAEIDVLQLVWNWRRLVHRENALDSIRIANAVVAVPMPADGSGTEYFRAESAYATFKFEDDGTIVIDRLTGLYCGIRLYVNGRLKPRAASVEPAPKQPASPEQKKQQFRIITSVVRELNSIRVNEPPQLDLDFDLDLSQPFASRVKARLTGSDVHLRGLRLDSVSVNVQMHDGAIDIEQFLVKLYKGEVLLHGGYDMARGRFDLQLHSTTDPTAFAAVLPRAAAAGLRQLRVRENPDVEVRLFLSPETGSVPQAQGSVNAGELKFYGVPFRAIRFAFATRGSELTVSDALVAMAEGQLTGHGDYDLESTDFAYEIDSTLDPTRLMPLMSPAIRRMVEPASFEAPPHVVASVSGDFVDPDAFAYDAQITAQRCRYRGVPLNCASANLRLRESQLNVSNLVLERDEGQLRGNVLADFNHDRVSFDIDTTANPTQMSPLLGEKAAQVMQSYRFGSNTTAHVAGLMDFADPAQTAWAATVKNDGFSYWKFTADRAQASLVFANNGMRIDDFDADFYDGKLQGRAEFAFANPEVKYHFDFDAEHCDVNRLLSAMSTKASEATGTLKGHCELEGHGSDPATLQGSGNLRINDGVLVEVPLFGIFSQILGKTKATDAKATFTIANGAAKTSDLQVAAGSFTARARGKIAFDGKLDFDVQAQFLSAWPGIGWIGKMIGALLEYHVGGTCSEPSYRAENLPKELLPHNN